MFFDFPSEFMCVSTYCLSDEIAKNTVSSPGTASSILSAMRVAEDYNPTKKPIVCHAEGCDPCEELPVLVKLLHGEKRQFFVLFIRRQQPFDIVIILNVV